jgi:signal peptidase I
MGVQPAQSRMIAADIPGMTLRQLLIGRSAGRSVVRGLAIGAFLMAASRFLLVPVRAHGISMLPTYDEGQFIFVNRLAYHLRTPRRGDIVAVTLRNGDAVLVKRIIAVGGESIRIDQGQVFVDGAALIEPYVKYRIPWDIEETTLAPDEVFVVGDNRSMAMKFHEFGRCDTRRILGPTIN